jgi:hypothetical protein
MATSSHETSAAKGLTRPMDLSATKTTFFVVDGLGNGAILGNDEAFPHVAGCRWLSVAQACIGSDLFENEGLFCLLVVVGGVS